MGSFNTIHAQRQLLDSIQRMGEPSFVKAFGLIFSAVVGFANPIVLLGQLGSNPEEYQSWDPAGSSLILEHGNVPTADPLGYSLIEGRGVDMTVLGFIKKPKIIWDHSLKIASVEFQLSETHDVYATHPRQTHFGIYRERPGLFLVKSQPIFGFSIPLRGWLVATLALVIPTLPTALVVRHVLHRRQKQRAAA